eukprot:scaffold1847_cov363-Pavlova_lutheri.AAC.1
MEADVRGDHNCSRSGGARSCDVNQTSCVPLRVHRPPLLVRYVCRTPHAAWHRRRSPPSSVRQWRGWQCSSARSMQHESR